MSVNCRFALDEKRNVIDAVNVANSGKAYCHKAIRKMISTCASAYF
jgi:hypothetical protein